MTLDPPTPADGTGTGSDPELRWFRGARATGPSSATAAGEPPREVRSIVSQYALSAVLLPIVVGGVPWLLTRAPDPFPVAGAVIATGVGILAGIACAVVALLLRAGSERTRRILTWPRGDETAADAVALGGWWMLTRERLRTPAARRWFHRRTMERARGRGGPR